jgi:hypothetical protein
MMEVVKSTKNYRNTRIPEKVLLSARKLDTDRAWRQTENETMKGPETLTLAPSHFMEHLKATVSLQRFILLRG